MKRKKISAFFFYSLTIVFIIFGSGCFNSQPDYRSEPIAVNRVPGERFVLFDGTGFEHWQMSEQDAWTIEDNTMRCNQKGYLWSREHFGNFVLGCDFKMSPGCNSGIFIRTGNPNNPVQTGIEVQIIDTYGKSAPDKHDTGALYDLRAPDTNAVKKPGEWNHITVTCDNNLISVVLNDIPVVNADIDKWITAHQNPDGTGNKFDLPVKDFPRTGFIGFQDHGDTIWFRNVVVTVR